MIFSPRRATWQRWRCLSTSQYSLLRGLEYEQIDGLCLRGRTLDMGGGQRNSYYHLLKIEGTLESVNIDPSMKPTLLADLNAPLPLATASYDNAISLNTFEHIRNDTLAIGETVRVLKPGGQLHMIVPFLYRVHGSPSDYHRHTAFWWVDFLFASGLSSETLTVEPLMWDPLSSAFSLVEFQFGRLRGMLKRLIMLVSVLSHTRWPNSERLPDSHGQYYAEYALGYYIHGVKQQGQHR